MLKRFANRREAGELLSLRLASYKDDPDVLVLALPRGGVPVGYEVARALGAPLDVVVVRKLGLPGSPEVAFGAIASGDVRVLSEHVVWTAELTPADVDAVAAAERQELERRERVYRGERAPPDLSGRTAVLVDDGLATGATMWAAVAAARRLRAGRVVVAVPVASAEALLALSAAADEVVCLMAPEHFQAVGQWYEDFSQVGDEEVRDLLASGAATTAAAAGRAVAVE
jgi:predicted phosphoribosyltransferase